MVVWIATNVWVMSYGGVDCTNVWAMSCGGVDSHECVGYAIWWCG